ncbi:response regulator [Tautonia marina]|uniref:response regulator n=1 Tax=Tautonia marina TaxID=2653855 RepID=UPI001260B7E1|nr:response regulator [Tautonia marina]
MTDRESPASDGPDAILLCQDLIFTSKITGTARELGYRVLLAGTAPLAESMLQQWEPRVVFVDLSHPHFAQSEVLLAYRNLAPEARFIAFGSHVDVQALSAARDVGCDPVLPRSKFTAELPALIQRYLGEES